MNRKGDLSTYSPGSPGSKGQPVQKTEMLKGKGKFTKAQMESNSTEPFSTGSAPDHGKLGGK